MNPLDITAAGWGSREVNATAGTLLAGVPGVDIVAYIGDSNRYSGPLSMTGWDEMLAGLADARERTDKPIAVINTITDVAYELTDALDAQGIIHLSGVRTAARAIGHAGRYARWRQERRHDPATVTVDEVRRADALALLP